MERTGMNDRCGLRAGDSSQFDYLGLFMAATRARSASRVEEPPGALPLLPLSAAEGAGAETRTGAAVAGTSGVTETALGGTSILRGAGADTDAGWALAAAICSCVLTA